MRAMALLAAAMAVLAPPVWGQPTPSGAAAAPPDTAVYEDAGVNVTGVRARARPGGSSTVEVSLDSARVRPAPSLDQVLRDMPLVVVRANSRGEVQPAFRGGEDRQIAVLVDGVPITVGWDHRTDLSIVPLASARRVSLVRGLSSVLLGPNVLAGAVEIDVARGGGPEAPPPPLTIDAGADHTGARSVGVSAGVLRRDPARGEWMLRAGGGYRGRDGLVLPAELDDAEPATRARFTSDGDLRLNTDLESLDAFFALRRVTGGGAWTSLSASGYRADRGVAPEAHLAEPRLWRYPYQARVLGALSAGTGMRPTPWGEGDLEASVGLDFGRTEIDVFETLEFRDATGSEDADDRTTTLRLLGDHTLGAAGDLRFASTWAETRHDEILDGGPSSAYRQRLWSVATETDWRAALAGVPVRFSVGAALDGSDTPESADKPPLGALTDWGARTGLTAVLANGRALVHGAASRRVRFPSLRELYSGALGRYLPNPELDPEAVLAGELGATFRAAGGRGELQLVGFHQRLEDAIVRISVAAPGGSKLQRVNQGAIRATGLELLASGNVRGLSLGADLTLQRARGEDAAGGEVGLEYEPAVAAGVRAEAPLPWAARIGFDLGIMGAQRGLDADTGILEKVPASATADLVLRRAFPLAAAPFGRLDAVLALENVLDEAAFDQLGLPLPGRTVRAQVRLW